MQKEELNFTRYFENEKDLKNNPHKIYMNPKEKIVRILILEMLIEII